MISNVEKSRIILDKFGIEKKSDLIQRLLEEHTIDGTQLFFSFQHLNMQSKCRFAFTSKKGDHIESYLTFDYKEYPIKVIITCKNIKNKTSVVRKYNLLELNKSNMNVLVNTILNTKFKKRYSLF